MTLSLSGSVLSYEPGTFLFSKLVHFYFSAGVGRTGTFVALLWLMQLCARGIRPDIMAAVEDLRLHRMWMVQKLVSTNFKTNTKYI